MLETRIIDMTGDWVHLNPSMEYKLVQNVGNNIVSCRVGNTGSAAPLRQDGILLEPHKGITHLTAGQGDVFVKGETGGKVVVVVNTP
jgi:hypothetical protein